MLGIESLKIFKRKFNYIYLLIAILFILSTNFLKSTYFPNIGITKEEFLFDYSFKLIIVLTNFFVILNITLSYAKDYNEKVSKLIRFSYTTRFYNLFAKMIANYIISVIFYFILVVLYLSVFYGDFNIIQSSKMKSNVISSLLLILFVVTLSLLMSTIFTNIYLSLPFTMLILTSLTFIREFISEQFKIQLAGDVFSQTFDKVSMQQTVDIGNITQLAIYSAGTFILSIIIKVIKNN